ncbi:MAG: glycosyltransferase [Desulfovibrio sp.]|jgi:glycosyltransferase involved in cell wall biosynthesis|nr:glycosyltransferase [Desulfovibrio sp.]
MKYSIITATYNSETSIERALTALLSQSYPNFEWLVQDGGSTDRTLEIINKYPDVRVKVNSEPDKGIYDAWNRAVARATGDWAIFLGADDMFANKDALVRSHLRIKRLSSRVQFAFGAMLQGVDCKVDHLLNRSLREAYRYFFINMSLPFPATFIRLGLLQKQQFDESYKIAGDYEFAARCLTRDNVARIPVVVSYMERGGMSEDNGRNSFLARERERVIRERVVPRAQEFATACVDYLWDEDNRLEEVPSSLGGV